MGMGVNYQCQTQPYNVEATQFVTNATGYHSHPNKTNNDVEAIHIMNCSHLSYIPKGLLRIFPNLVGMYLQGCGISSLAGTELIEYPNLKLFALELSPLEYVPGNLFAHNPDIFFVSFTDNKIKTIGTGFLANSTKLSEIYFENNTCINANASSSLQVPEFIEKLNHQCSIAGGIPESVTLTVILCTVAYFGKFIWTE